ncbi:hypothetical protein L7F22_001707 [Adiantum nelumboides]|nr:hypothetical protein [Adiantum nelumboides]
MPTITLYLPLVEYAYNNTVHTSIGKAPFEVIEGRSKSPLLLKVHGKIFAADEYSRDLKESFQKIKEAISISQQKQKAATNKHRRALAFKENDCVLLKFPKARLRHTSGKNPTGHQKYYAKLAKRYYVPFQILKPINEMAYQLKLPNHWLIHNAFHVNLLKPYKEEPPCEAIMEDPSEVEDQEEVLQLESIMRHEDKSGEGPFISAEVKDLPKKQFAMEAKKLFDRVLGSVVEKGKDDDSLQAIDVRRKLYGSRNYIPLMLLLLCGLAALGLKIRKGNWHHESSLLVVIIFTISIKSCVIYMQKLHFSNIEKKWRKIMQVKVGQLMPAQPDAVSVKETQLQSKVREGVSSAEYIGAIVCIVVFAAAFIHGFIAPRKGSEDSWSFKLGQTSAVDTVETFLNIIQYALINAIVLVPEGLPLAVSCSLAHATKNVIANLVLTTRKLGDFENMGHVTSVCIDTVLRVRLSCTAIHQCEAAGIKVRMISGDSLEKAEAIATACGILNNGFNAVEASTSSKLEVMAGSSLTHVSLLISILREKNEVVAVISADGLSSQEADQVMHTIRWSRAVYLNTQRFLQFQVAPILTIGAVNVLCVLYTGDLSLTVAQLLWVSLLMVILGMLALAQEPPSIDILNKPPVKINEPLMSNIMWRNLILQSFYQMVVLLLLQNTHLLKLGGEDADDVKRTVLFNVFVFCQAFNLVNARESEKMNIFQGILRNWLLLGVEVGIVVSQVVLVEFLGMFASTAKLSWQYW